MITEVDPALVPVAGEIATLEDYTGTRRGRRSVTLDYAEMLVHAALEDLDRPGPAPLLKCIYTFRSNMHLVNHLKSWIYHDSSKCICIFDFVFSTAPESAASYQKGVYIHTLVSRRRALYRYSINSINKLVRLIGHGAGGGSGVRGSKTKSNMHMHLVPRGS